MQMNTEIQSTLFQEDFLANLSPLPETTRQEDDRYLWYEMLRVIREVKPQIVIGENVAGIVDLALDTVLSDLEGESYKTEAFIIRTLCHQRPSQTDRVWIIAYTEHWWNGWGSNNRKANKKRLNLMKTPTTFDATVKRWGKQIRNSEIREFGTRNNERVYSEPITSNTESTGQQMCENRQRKEQLRGSATRDIWQEWTTEPRFVEWTMGYPTGWTN